jgi:large subunit ribosomal protein L17
MLSNMSASLFLHKRITTTLAKAKELKKHVEPLVTRAKEDTTHNRRMAFSFLQNKEAIKVLFGEVAEKVGNRPGGYTRIIKTGFRLGDNAEMCIIELVDFNELMLKDTKPAKKTTRRSRRGSSGKSGSEKATDTSKTEDKPDADKAEGSETAPKTKAKAKPQAEEDAKAETKETDSKTEPKEAPKSKTKDTASKAETEEAPKDENKDSGEKDKKESAPKSKKGTSEEGDNAADDKKGE